MPKAPPKRNARRATYLKRHPAMRREINADAVIRDLLDLFEHLGVGAERFASSIAAPGSKTLPSSCPDPNASAIGELLTVWHQDTTYLDELGSPIPLKMHARHRSFQRLAKKAVPTLDPKVLLTELINMRAVTVNEDGHICVQRRSLPVYEDKKLAIQYTLMTLDNFVRTLRHNLKSGISNSDQLFHRIAWKGDFDAHEIPSLKINVKRYGQRFLESCDNWIMRQTKSQTHKLKTKRKDVQVSVGVYLAIDGT
jgi:hypothetical protein